MRTINQAVAAAVCKAPVMFTMQDIEAGVRSIEPHLRWAKNTLYGALDSLEERGVVSVVRSSKPKTWRRTPGNDTAEQLEIDFSAEAEEPPMALRGKLLPGQAQAAVAAVVALKAPGAVFTSVDVRREIERTYPRLHMVMGLTSHVTALRAMEHRRMIKRIGRRGGCIVWRREAKHDND